MPELLHIAIEHLSLDPNAPRRALNSPALHRLAEDLLRRGCLQPLLIRPLPTSSASHTSAPNDPTTQRPDDPHTHPSTDPHPSSSVLRPPSSVRYTVITGSRRLRAAQIAGLSHLPCLVREADDTGALQIQLADDLLTESLSPLERGLALRRLYELLKRQGKVNNWQEAASHRRSLRRPHRPVSPSR